MEFADKFFELTGEFFGIHRIIFGILFRGVLGQRARRKNDGRVGSNFREALHEFVVRGL